MCGPGLERGGSTPLLGEDSRVRADPAYPASQHWTHRPTNVRWPRHSSLVVGRLLADRCRPTQQLLPDDKRQPGTGLTKRRGRKALGYQAGQVVTRDVAMEDLQDQERDGGDRLEQARAPLLGDSVKFHRHPREMSPTSRATVAAHD